MLICNFFLITLKKSLKNLKDHTFINNYWTWKNDIEYTHTRNYTWIKIADSSGRTG